MDQGIPLPVVQMGHVEKIVEVAQNQPHVQQLVAQETVKAELQQANSQVQQVDGPEEGRKVEDRKKERGRKQGGGGRQPGRQGSGGDPDEEEAERQSMNPWSGHIVNVKI